MAVVGVGTVGSDLATVGDAVDLHLDTDRAEGDAGLPGRAERGDQREHLLGPRVGRKIEIGAEPTQQGVTDRPADEEQVMPVADEPVSEAGGHRRNAQQLLDRAPGGLGGGVGDGHGRTAYEQGNIDDTQLGLFLCGQPA